MARSIPAREQLAAEVADLAHALSRRVGRSAKAELHPLGITWSQVRALRSVAAASAAANGDPVRMGALASALGVVPRSATSVVEALVERGLVARAPDPSDRRAVAVAVTSDGKALLDQLVARRRSAAGEVLADLSPTELATVRDLLARALRQRPEPTT